MKDRVCTSGRVNAEGKGGWIWLVYFIYLYEKRTMKPVESFYIGGEGDEGEWWWGGEPNQGTMQAYMEMSQWNPLYN
jgi:hypothetical protein